MPTTASEAITEKVISLALERMTADGTPVRARPAVVAQATIDVLHRHRDVESLSADDVLALHHDVFCRAATWLHGHLPEGHAERQTISLKTRAAAAKQEVD